MQPHFFSESEQHDRFWKAIDCNNLDIVQQILDQGFNVNSRNDQNLSPLYLSASMGYTELCNLLLKFDAELESENGPFLMTPLLAALEGSHMHTALFLLKNGADPSHANEEETTPLHLACRKGLEHLVLLLLNKGINLDVQDFLGETALFEAANQQQHTILELLIEAGANPVIKDHFDETIIDKYPETEDKISFLLSRRQGG